MKYKSLQKGSSSNTGQLWSSMGQDLLTPIFQVVGKLLGVVLDKLVGFHFGVDATVILDHVVAIAWHHVKLFNGFNVLQLQTGDRAVVH